MIFEIFDEALETLPPYRVAIGMRMKTLSENGEKNSRSETERIVTSWFRPTWWKIGCKVTD
jgi:hypothetical protein